MLRIDQLAARHRRQPLPALFFAAVGVDRVHAQRALHRHEAAQARIATFQFLTDRSRNVDVDVFPRAAVNNFEMETKEEILFRPFRFNIVTVG